MSAQASPIGARPKARRHRASFARRHARLLILLALVGCLATVAGVGIALARTRYLPAVDEARLLKTDLTAAIGRLREAGLALDEGDVADLRTTVARVEARVAGLHTLVEGDPLIGLARGLPPTSDAVAGTDAILAAAGHLVDAADTGLVLADRYVALRREALVHGRAAGTAPDTAAGAAGSSAEGDTLANLVALMATGQDEIDAILADLEAADAAVRAAPAELPGPIGEARDQVAEQLAAVLPVLRSYAAVDGTLPSVLGWDRPRTYLVLTQNPAELRPTGGFIGSYGLVTFDRGRLVERAFRDVFLLDVPFTAYPFLEAPVALRRYLLGTQQPWQLADANWSPDFPTAARQAMTLYANEGGEGAIDGVFGISTLTIDRLLEITGPVRVAPDDVTIAAGETTLKVLQQTRVAKDGENRKAFLAAFGDALIDRLLALPAGQWPALAGAVEGLAADDLVTAWFADPDAQSLAAGAGLDGTVRTDAGDYVYPVDANVAPVSKLNAVTDRALDLRIVIDGVGNAEHALGVAWTNRIDEPANEPYRTLPGISNTSVLGLYTRLYVPARSRLGEISGGGFPPLTAPAEITDELGRTVYGAYLRVPAGTTTLRTSWTSPYAADLGEDGVFTYHLVIQHQPGQRTGSIDLSVALPPAATVIETTGDLDARAGTLTYHGTFTRDLVVDVRYRLPKGAR